MNYKRIEITHKPSGRRFAKQGESSEVDAWFASRQSRGKYQPASDYEIVETDLTQEYEAKEQARESRKQEIRQIKQAINLIDNSDKPNWEKKLLKRLIRELRE